MTLSAGDPAPDFALPSTRGELRLRDMILGKKLVLAFYAEDNTPLCSNEVAMLKADYETVRELVSDVLAVSSDSLGSHLEFAEQLGGIPFALASDENLEAARLYGVADQEARRCRRAVFVIGTDGRIVHAEPWFQPRNPSQYEAVFRALGLDV